MKQNSVYIESLGCAKNTVDTSSMQQVLQKVGFTLCEKPGQAEFLIVNTCGFIESARQESIQVLKELSANKKRGQFLVAAGCFTQMIQGEITRQVNGIDGVLGTRHWMDIASVFQKIRHRSGKENQAVFHFPDADTALDQDEKGILRAALQGNSAYLKIADGCHRTCSFCSIPLIKGPLVSRSIESILADVRQLNEFGVKELILIAQDTTAYGMDLGVKNGLPTLLEKVVSNGPDIPWIRFLYTYPGFDSGPLIEVMQSHSQIVPYLDMPLQHAHPEILRQMRRPSDIDWVLKTIQRFREALPALAVRTTLIVGFPGETEREFETLLEFVKEIRFDHLGAFTYSFENGTPAEPLGDPVPIELKQERLERLMLTQQDISLQLNQGWIGRTIPVLVEGFNNGISIGRSHRDAPEIDGLVLVQGEAPLGQIIPVRISSALAHDLIGEWINKN
jgi:ribosomal protein S12 methylthiotransferase